MARQHDPLFPGDPTAEKFRGRAVQRVSTLRSAAPKTAAVLNRSGDLSPTKPRPDPYMPPLSAVSGYDKGLQPAIRFFAAADRRAQAAKKGRRK